MAVIKLLHITASLKMGGAERFLLHLTSGLKDDFDQTVITFHQGPFVEKIRSQGIPVFYISGYFFHYDPVFFYRLIRKVWYIKPDCMHSVLWIANVVSRVISSCMRIPLVCGLHSPLNSNTGNSLIRRSIDHALKKRATCYVAVSEQIYQSYSYNAPLLQIDNGIECIGIQKKDKYYTDRFVIGSVGRFVSIKNQRILLQLIAHVKDKIPSVHLLLVGEGPLHDDLVHEAQELGIVDRVEIVSGDAEGFYHNFDLFILPSFAEGLSLSLLEAMSAHIPVVTTYQDDGHAVIKHEKNGYLFDPYKLQELVDVVLMLFDHPQKRAKMAASSFYSIESRFALGTMVKKYRKIFKKIAKKTLEFDF